MICTLVNPKGGVGKSTTVFNLAVRASRDRYRVSVIDMDIQESIRDFLEDRDAAGLSRPFEYTALHGLPVGEMGPRIEEIAAAADVTFIDTPARYTEESFVALALANLALVPMVPTRADYVALRQLIRRLPLKENPELPIFVYLNKVRNHRYLKAPDVYATLLEEEVPYLTFANLMVGNRVYWERSSMGLALDEQDPVSMDAIGDLERLYRFTRQRLFAQ